MTVFIIIIFLLLYLILSNRKINRGTYLLALFTAIFIVGASSGGGPDATLYFDKAVKNWGDTLDYPSVFPGFKFFSYVVIEKLNIDFRMAYACLLFTPLIYLGLIKVSSPKRLILPTLILGTAFGFGGVFGEIRQILGLTYAATGIVLLQEKKRFAFLFILLATSFHITAVVLIAVYFILQSQNLKNIVRSLLCVSIAIFVLSQLLSPIYLNNLAWYATRGYGTLGPGFSYLSLYLILLYFVKIYYHGLSARWNMSEAALVILIILIAFFDYTGVRLGFVIFFGIVLNHLKNFNYNTSVAYSVGCLSITTLLFLRSYIYTGFTAFKTLILL